MFVVKCPEFRILNWLYWSSSYMRSYLNTANGPFFFIKFYWSQILFDHFTPSNVATSARRPTSAHLSFLRYSLYLFVLFTTHIICSVPFQLRYITRFTTIPVSLVCCFIHAFVAERLALFLLGRPSTSRQGTYFTRLHVSVSARLSFLKR